MVRETLKLDSSKEGAVLNVNIWYPEEKPKAIVQFMHGMIDQSRRHKKMGEYMSERGIVFIANDHLGHGQTMPEERGYFADKNGDEYLVQDQKIVSDYVTERFPGVPLFVTGHSFGSFIVRMYIYKYGENAKGAIIEGTGHPGVIELAFGRTVANLSCWFLGKHHVAKNLNYFSCLIHDKQFTDSKLPMRWLTSNYGDLKNIFKNYGDQLFTFKAGGFRDMFRMIAKVKKKSNVVKTPKNLPILYISGSEDMLGKRTKAVYKSAELYKENGNEVEVRIYENVRHDLESDSPDRLHEDVYQWVSAHL